MRGAWKFWEKEKQSKIEGSRASEKERAEEKKREKEEIKIDRKQFSLNAKLPRSAGQQQRSKSNKIQSLQNAAHWTKWNSINGNKNQLNRNRLWEHEKSHSSTSCSRCI